jgi:hypothetical protein
MKTDRNPAQELSFHLQGLIIGVKDTLTVDQVFVAENLYNTMMKAGVTKDTPSAVLLYVLSLALNTVLDAVNITVKPKVN